MGAKGALHRLRHGLFLCIALILGTNVSLANQAPAAPLIPSLPAPSTSFTQQEFPYVNPGQISNPTSGTGISTGLQRVRQTLPQGIQQEESASRLVLEYVNYFMGFYPYVAVGLIIYFGVQLILSRGDAEARKKAVSGIVNIAIGTLLIYLAYGIVAFILSLTSVQTASQALMQ